MRTNWNILTESARSEQSRKGCLRYWNSNMTAGAKNIIVILFTQFFICSSWAQTDSLWRVWEDPKMEDTLRMQALKDIAMSLAFKDSDSAYSVAQLQLEFAEKNNHPSYAAQAISVQGITYYAKRDMDSAAIYTIIALNRYIEAKDKTGEAKCNNNLGLIYKDKGDYLRSIEYYDEALKIKEKLGIKADIASTKMNIAILLTRQGEFDQAMKYLEECLHVRIADGDKKGEAKVLSNMAIVYEERKDFESCLEVLERSFLLSKEIGNQREMGNSLNNIGTTYKDLNELDSALKYFEQALEMKLKVNDVRNLGSAYSNIGEIYLLKEDYRLALKYCQKAEEYNLPYGTLIHKKRNYHRLYKVYKKLGRISDALTNLEKYIAAKDSVTNDETKSAAIKFEMNYNFSKEKDSISYAQAQKDALTKAEQKRKDDLAEASNERKNILLFSIGGGVILLAGFLIFVFNRLKVTKKQKNIIEEQKSLVEEHQQEITDSILYAKRIQNAILPPSRLVKEYLKDSFILYKPKDVVAGDFYWLEQKNGKVLFAAADCTGHGVPGAMVSVLCNGALNRSVREFDLIEPGQILDKAREIVIQEFEKSEEEVKDGMDIALCSLEAMPAGRQGNKLKYAGAHNPLWIVRNGEIIETKANKQPIGKFDNPVPYTTHSFELQKGDSLYIFSDGYVDQFGGEKGKKFKAKAFRALLLSIQDKTMEEQRLLIDEAFEAWRGKLEQIDDVCVIGVRV